MVRFFGPPAGADHRKLPWRRSQLTTRFLQIKKRRWIFMGFFAVKLPSEFSQQGPLCVEMTWWHMGIDQTYLGIDFCLVMFGVCSFHVGKIYYKMVDTLSTKIQGNILICQLHTSFSPIHLVFNSWQVRKSPWRWSILGGVQLPSCTPSHDSTPPPPHRGWVTELSPNRGVSFKNDGSKQIPAEFGVFFLEELGATRTTAVEVDD